METPKTSKIFHTSDLHLSFVSTEKSDGTEILTVAKPMDQRKWSIGTENYVNYLNRLQEFANENISDTDIVVVTGDITHNMNMTKHPALHSFRWLNNSIKGIKVLIRGNHDIKVDFGQLKMHQTYMPTLVMLEEGAMTTLGNYAFGCYSNHKSNVNYNEQETFDSNIIALKEFAARFADFASKNKKIPIMLSHYPVFTTTAEELGNLGIKGYLSGHVHCTNNKVLPAQADWSWYEKSAGLTDDKTFNGCYFSTGTTDVLLNRIGQIMKRIDEKII